MVVYPFSTSPKLAGWNAGSYVAPDSVDHLDHLDRFGLNDLQSGLQLYYRMIALNGSDRLK